MIRAYNEIYLNDAMTNLGEAFDYAVNACGLALDEFMDMFIVSGYADSFSKGSAKVVSGMSGTELVLSVIKRSGISAGSGHTLSGYDFSAEYWTGWVTAYYQWYTGRSFKDIVTHIKISDVYNMYPLMHEASEDRFVQAVENMIAREKKETRLQKQRKISGYSQSQLAKLANVNLRTLQQYESGAKNINRASAETVLSLSKVLGCNAEDILEPQFEIQS